MENIPVAGGELSSMSLGQGPAVVMLHGLATGNMATWYSSFASPLAANHRVVLYDQRGHGGSSVPASGYDLDTQADDLEAVIAHHGLDTAPFDLVGHSMGALVALHFALRHPLQLRRLVLVDAPMPAREYVAPSLKGVHSREALAAYAEKELSAVMGHGGRRREKLLNRLNTLFFESTLVQDVMAMQAEPEAALAALPVPVLLVYGRQSPCLAAGKNLLRLLPRATLAQLDCGHYIPEEAPKALLAALEAFLSTPPLQASTATALPAEAALP